MMATMSAAKPEGIHCSAHATAPLPHSSRRAPTIAAERHSIRTGAATPRARSAAKSSAPATENRVPDISSGGSVSMAIRMAR